MKKINPLNETNIYNNKISIYKLNQEGFTLVELLTVLGILVLLLTIVLVAVNPSKHFTETNNVKRSNDVITLLNAIQQYSIDNDGNLPSGITTSSQNISSSNLDICDLVVSKYIAAMPFDPETGFYSNCGNYDTQYTLKKGDNNRIIIEAPDAQDGAVIKVTR